VLKSLHRLAVLTGLLTCLTALAGRRGVRRFGQCRAGPTGHPTVPEPVTTVHGFVTWSKVGVVRTNCLSFLSALAR
jgi:hypothetical protein